MHLPFTSFILTSKTGTWPVVNRSPQWQIPGRLASGFRAVCILVLLGLTNLSAWAQCSGNIVLSSQAQVNAFPARCASYDGEIIIQGNDITDLSPLANLQSIHLAIIIKNNPLLTSLNGLNALTSVGNNL